MEGIRLYFLSLIFSMVILRMLVSLHSQYCQFMFVFFMFAIMRREGREPRRTGGRGENRWPNWKCSIWTIMHVCYILMYRGKIYLMINVYINHWIIDQLKIGYMHLKKTHIYIYTQEETHTERENGRGTHVERMDSSIFHMDI